MISVSQGNITFVVFWNFQVSGVFKNEDFIEIFGDLQISEAATSGILKNFGKCKGKHVCKGKLFFKSSFKTATLLKKQFHRIVFLWFRKAVIKTFTKGV